MTNRQKLFKVFVLAAAAWAGVLFTTYHMIAWYGRIGGICG